MMSEGGGGGGGGWNPPAGSKRKTRTPHSDVGKKTVIFPHPRNSAGLETQGLSLFAGIFGHAAEVPRDQWRQALQKPGKEGTWTKRLVALQTLSKRAVLLGVAVAVQETEQTNI